MYVPIKHIILTMFVYRIQLKNRKNNWVRSVVFSVSWMIINVWLTLQNVLSSLLKLLFIIPFIILNKKRNRSKKTVSCKIPIHLGTLPLLSKMKHEMWLFFIKLILLLITHIMLSSFCVSNKKEIIRAGCFLLDA